MARHPGADVGGTGRYGVVESRHGKVVSAYLFPKASQTRGIVKMLLKYNNDAWRNEGRSYEFEDFGDPLVAALEEQFGKAA